MMHKIKLRNTFQWENMVKEIDISKEVLQLIYIREKCDSYGLENILISYLAWDIKQIDYT